MSVCQNHNNASLSPGAKDAGLTPTTRLMDFEELIGWFDPDVAEEMGRGYGVRREPVEKGVGGLPKRRQIVGPGVEVDDVL
ncbi:MAG TPA: hypothetical protein VFX03_10880, partial [Thermomicrobiales bacterium]|nr:hypothetical protein [Thermomicrobiales bacterium]